MIKAGSCIPSFSPLWVRCNRHPAQSSLLSILLTVCLVFRIAMGLRSNLQTFYHLRPSLTPSMQSL